MTESMPSAADAPPPPPAAAEPLSRSADASTAGGETGGPPGGGLRELLEPGRLFPVPGLVRRVRRIADLSQRELASRVGASASTIGRIEAGSLHPSLAILLRIFGAAELALVVVDRSGRVVLPMLDRADLRDGADRRYPAHLDVVLDPVGNEWWADRYGLTSPPETFHRDRRYRDDRRRRSQWEVRVARYRAEPEPPNPLTGARGQVAFDPARPWLWPGAWP